jgi:hypothetical protein
MQIDQHFFLQYARIATILVGLLGIVLGLLLRSKLAQARKQRAHFSSVVGKFLDASEMGLANARDQFAGI